MNLGFLAVFLCALASAVPEVRATPVTTPGEDRVGRMTLTGRAVAAGGQTPAAFAEITADCKRVVCVADAEGAFHCAIARPVTGSICVEHSRLGRKRIELPVGERIELGRLELIEGGTVRVVKPLHVELPPETTVTLLRGSSPLGDPQPIGSREWIEFAGVESGSYSVLLAGPGALQRKLFPVEVESPSEAEVLLSIDPFLLTGLVEYRNRPLAAAELTLSEDAWEATLKTDQSGRFEAELWAAGDYGVVVDSPPIGEPYAIMRHAAISESEWLLTVPSRRITGRVFDAETERPITEASLTVESVSNDTRRNRNVQVQPNGTFVLSGISEGQYVISASAPSYLPGERLELNVREGDGDQQLDLSLLRGVPIVVRVVDSRNAPISRATVITAVGPAGEVTDLTKTDENGLATIPVAERSQKIIYVIPSGGSFAVSRLTADQSESGMRVVVPDAPATLHLQTRSTAGEPIPGVSFALRYAGGELPVGVMRTLARVRGVTFVTDSTGKVTITGLPVGAYALGWKQAGHAGLLGDGWQGVELVAGETTVTQTFSLPDTGRGATP